MASDSANKKKATLVKSVDVRSLPGGQRKKAKSEGKGNPEKRKRGKASMWKEGTRVVW